MKRILCVLCLFSLLGCNNKDVLVKQHEKVKCNVDEITLSILESDIWESIEVVPIKTPDNVMLGDQLSVSVGNKSYYVADCFGTDKIYRLNNDGELINTIGSKGRAGNEYLGISDFYVDNDKNEIVIYSTEESKELVFDTLGNLKRAKNYENTTFHRAIPDSIYTWFYLGYANMSSKWRIVRLNSADSIVFGDLKSDYKLIPMPERASVFTRNKKDIYLREAISNIVYKINGENVDPLYEFDFGENRIPESVFIQSSAMDAAEILFSKKFTSITHFMQNDNYAVVDLYLHNNTGNEEADTDSRIGVKNLLTGSWQWFKTPFRMKCLTQKNELIFTVEPTVLLNDVDQNRFKNPDVITSLQEDGNTVLLKCILK